MAIRKMIKDPAIANEDTSIPNMPRRGLPINKNASNIKKETKVTFADFILPDLDFISIIIGIEPGISIMANRTINAARISIRLKCIALVLYKYNHKNPNPLLKSTTIQSLFGNPPQHSPSF
jgi:hypothetical protein